MGYTYATRGGGHIIYIFCVVQGGREVIKSREEKIGWLASAHAINLNDIHRSHRTCMCTTTPTPSYYTYRALAYNYVCINIGGYATSGEYP